jgi:hypothetical protein
MPERKSILESPLSPSEAGEHIVETLLSDLPADRKEAVRAAIEKAVEEWAELIGDISAIRD